MDRRAIAGGASRQSINTNINLRLPWNDENNLRRRGFNRPPPQLSSARSHRWQPILSQGRHAHIAASTTLKA
jgi:hypothetical protein